MSNFVVEKTDSLDRTLKIAIKQKDFEPKFKAELRKFGQKHPLKGFRKGKTPMAYIKKRFGGSIFFDLLNKEIERELGVFLEKESENIFFHPIFREDIDQPVLDFKEIKDSEFTFLVGFKPEFDLIEPSDEDTFVYYEIELDDAVDDALANLRKDRGQWTPVESKVDEKSLIELKAVELEGDDVKKDGWETTFDLAINFISDEEVKKLFLGKKKGDKVRFNIFELNKDTDGDYVKKNMLNFEEADISEGTEVNSMFEGVIEAVKKRGEAEMDEAFFESAFGPGVVKTEEEARAFIKKDYEKFYTEQADNFLFGELKKVYSEKHANIPLPEEFLTLWLKRDLEERKEDYTEELKEVFFGDLRWSLVVDKLIKKYEINISDDDIANAYKANLKAQFGAQLPDSFLDSLITEEFWKSDDAKKIADEVAGKKLYTAIKENVKLDIKKVSYDEFKEIVEKYVEKKKEEVEAK